MADLFETQNWVGNFFISIDDGFANRFAGELNYSPKDGVILSYTRLLIPGETIFPDHSYEKLKIIYGILSSGERCTLIGLQSFESNGIFKSPLEFKKEKIGFQYLIIGDFLTGDELIHKFKFTLTNMQEFFFPKWSMNFVKYSKSPVVSVHTDFGNLSIRNSAKFDVLHSDITSQIYSEDEAALLELQESFDSIQNKHPDAYFSYKKHLSYSITLDNKLGITIASASEHIKSITDLFCLLIYNPVNIRVMQAMKNEPNKTWLTIYPTMLLNERLLDLTLKEKNNRHMPIKNSNINLEDILSKWCKTANNYSMRPLHNLPISPLKIIEPFF